MFPRKIIKGIKALLQGRFIFLCFSSMLLFVVFPFLNQQHVVGLVLINVVFMIILLSAIRAIIYDNKALKATGLVLAFLALIFGWGSDFITNRPIMIFSIIIDLLFYGFITTVILVHVLQDEDITADKIFGVICVYMFLGLVWAQIFSLLEIVHPGSFNFADEPAGYQLLSPGGEGTTRSGALIHFSYITLTTVGYGDITPATAPAGALACMEAVVGQLYLAAIVARLVGLHVVQSMKSRNT